jgi:hypothetical protein
VGGGARRDDRGGRRKRRCRRKGWRIGGVGGTEGGGASPQPAGARDLLACLSLPLLGPPFSPPHPHFGSAFCVDGLQIEIGVLFFSFNLICYGALVLLFPIYLVEIRTD